MKYLLMTSFYKNIYIIFGLLMFLASNTCRGTDTTCQLIWTQTNDPSDKHDRCEGLAVDNDALYIVGYDELPGSDDLQWRIEKRSLTDEPQSGHRLTIRVMVMI